MGDSLGNQDRSVAIDPERECKVRRGEAHYETLRQEGLQLSKVGEKSCQKAASP